MTNTIPKMMYILKFEMFAIYDNNYVSIGLLLMSVWKHAWISIIYSYNAVITHYWMFYEYTCCGQKKKSERGQPLIFA